MRPPGFVTALVSLLALASVAFLGKSYESSLRGIDSNIHAAVSMSVTSGPGLAPRLPIPIRNFSASAPAAAGSKLDPDRYFNDHPFFLFWANGLVMRALGPNAWSARLLTALFSVGSVLVVYLIGARLRSRAFGMLAGLFLVFCRDFILTSATMSLDTALVFFIVLSTYLWLTGRWAWMGLAAGVGLWVKTPIVLLAFPTALVHGAIRRELKRTLPGLAAAGAVAIAVGSLIWVYTGLHGGWELVRDYWSRQLWGTAVGGRGQEQGTQWGFFWHYVRTGFLPGLPFLLIGLIQVARRRRWLDPAFLSSAVAVLILAAVVTAIRFKLGHYVTPAFPFLALIAAYSVSDWAERNENRLYPGVTLFTTLLLAVLVVSPIRLGPEAFVAMKRFVPFIQTHGSCEDHVALVPGGEPVGGDLDYRLFLNFYTGRHVDITGCEALRPAVSSGRAPAWVILSHENLAKCVSPEDRQRFTGTFRMGSQYLLTTRMRSEPVVDLTPLELELQAVTDCKAPPYPRDMWHRYVE